MLGGDESAGVAPAGLERRVKLLEDALRAHFEALILREAFADTSRRRASSAVR